MSIRNSERFLFAYNRIEKSMGKISGLTAYMSFSRLIDKTKRDNSIIRKFEDDLRLYANLRNAIVHNRTDAEYAIAEPHDDIVELIEYIDRKLAKPVTVGELFRRKVHTLKTTDTLIDGLELIRKQRFNQIPIYRNNEFFGLVTATGITLWLADECPEGNITREIPTLIDIYQYEKKKITYRFIEKDFSVYAAEDCFKRAVSQGKRLDALLITENGDKKEKLIGIITPADLLKIE